MNFEQRLKRVLMFSLIIVSISSCGGGGGGTESHGIPPAPGPQSATVSWSPVTLNSDNTTCTDLAGYRIYFSEQHPVTKNNSQMIDVGNTTLAQINNLAIGHTYYVRIASYDSSNNESELSSDEVNKTIN